MWENTYAWCRAGSSEGGEGTYRRGCLGAGLGTNEWLLDEGCAQRGSAYGVARKQEMPLRLVKVEVVTCLKAAHARWD